MPERTLGPSKQLFSSAQEKGWKKIKEEGFLKDRQKWVIDLMTTDRLTNTSQSQEVDWGERPVVKMCVIWNGDAYVLIMKLLRGKIQLTQAAWNVFICKNNKEDYQLLPLLEDCLRAAYEETSGIKAP